MKFSKFVNAERASLQQPLDARISSTSTKKQESPCRSDDSDHNTVKSSARVLQLKREIEDLDSRLMQTNSVNFEDARSIMRASHLDALKSSSYSSDGAYSKAPNEIDELMRQSMASLKDKKSVHIYNQISSAANAKMLNTSHFTQEGEISFDIEKIAQSRQLNLKSALETNLKEKKDFITEIRSKIGLIQKECEAKSMKLTHLKFERDSIINMIQVESIKKTEQTKEAKEQVKRIDIKKKEDERAFFFAQNEIKRQIYEQDSLIRELVSQIDSIEQELQGLKEKGILEDSDQSLPASNELQERINQQQIKIQSLSSKKADVENNVQILKSFLKSISEEIQMTQEDLSGKLMQRAEFVAQREELDQMYDSGRMSFGKCFELYLKINDINGVPSGSASSRYLSKEYEIEKVLSFFSNLLQQIKHQCKSKHHEMIDLVQQKIENSALATLDTAKCIAWVCQVASQLGIQLENKVLQRRLEMSSKEKDELFSQRQQQLRDIILEVKRFEGLIKENSNLVDNMILPQLKAMSSTYTEHKAKYKKLKQASFVLRERLRKAERDMHTLVEERNKVQQHRSIIGAQVKSIEGQFKALNEKLLQEREEMDRLTENASQIEKEFRRAQHTLMLKEREVTHSINVDQSLNQTQISVLSNQRQKERDDERLKKRFNEIEEKIRGALQEKEEADSKLFDYQRLLKEAIESCEHAEQVVQNSHRIMESNPNNRRHYIGSNKLPLMQQPEQQQDHNESYQITSFTDNDQFEFDPKVKHQSSRQFADDKENLQRQVRVNRDSIMKLDLSKLNKESNQPSTYSGQRSNGQRFEQINYEKKQDEIMQRSQNGEAIQGLNKQNQAEVNMFNEDLVNMLQQSRLMNESENNSSLMNLSELIINNNPAIKNILQNGQQNGYLSFKQSQENFRQSQSSLGAGLLQNNEDLLNSQSKYQLANSLDLGHVGQHHNPNQSSLVDNSLLQYLDDINFNTSGGGSQSSHHQSLLQLERQRRTLQALRRSSVETAEFLMKQEELSRKQIQAIDVDLSNRQQFMYQTSPDDIQSREYLNRHMSQHNPPQLTQSVNFNTQSLSHTHSTQRSNNTANPQIRQSTSKGSGGWMSKYLSNGNDFSRMYGAALQESVSPQPNSRRGSKTGQMNWNRPTSFENRFVSYGTNNQLASMNNMNVSSNSMGSLANYNSIHNQSYAAPEGMTYSRSGSQLKKTRKLNKSMNGIDSSTLLQQSINTSSLLNPTSQSMNFGQNLQNVKSFNCNHSNMHGPECIQFSKVDVSFAERIVPLLDGAAFYKKFSSRQSLNENAFDPLNSDKFPPENCGYGIRLFQLDKSLLCINVRMSLKIAVETTISLNDIVKPILPQTTMDIIRAQKHYLSSHHNGMRKSSRNGYQPQLGHMAGSSSSKDLLEEFLILESKGSISHLAKIGIVNKNSELYRQKCLDSTFYPFSIALKNGRVELIATSYETLKNWIIGINLLVSNKKHIPKLKQLMELKLD